MIKELGGDCYWEPSVGVDLMKDLLKQRTVGVEGGDPSNPYDATVWSSPETEGEVRYKTRLTVPEGRLYIFRALVDQKTKSSLLAVFEDLEAEVVVAHMDGLRETDKLPYSYKDWVRADMLIASTLTVAQVKKVWEKARLSTRRDLAYGGRHDARQPPHYPTKVSEGVARHVGGWLGEIPELVNWRAHKRIHHVLINAHQEARLTLRHCPMVGFEELWSQYAKTPALYRSHRANLDKAPRLYLEEAEVALRFQLLESLGDPREAASAAHVVWQSQRR